MTSVTVIESPKTVIVTDDDHVTVVTSPSAAAVVDVEDLGPQGPGGALPIFASIIDTTDQAIGAANVAQPIQLGTVIESRGITVTSGNRITFSLPGTYKIFVSLQIANMGNSLTEANFYFKKNGSELPATNTRIDLQPRKSQSVPYHDYFAIEIQTTLAKDDYIQAWWVTDHVDVSIETLPATGAHPQAPGVILNVAQAMNYQAAFPNGINQDDILTWDTAENIWKRSDALTALAARVTALENA